MQPADINYTVHRPDDEASPITRRCSADRAVVHLTGNGQRAFCDGAETHRWMLVEPQFRAADENNMWRQIP